MNISSSCRLHYAGAVNGGYILFGINLNIEQVVGKIAAWIFNNNINAEIFKPITGKLIGNTKRGVKSFPLKGGFLVNGKVNFSTDGSTSKGFCNMGNTYSRA